MHEEKNKTKQNEQFGWKTDNEVRKQEITNKNKIKKKKEMMTYRLC